MMIKLDKSKNYLLACSFGPDSMALFHMLQEEGIKFSAALVNYHLRPESDNEMNSFIKYCKQLNVTYYIKDLVHGIGDENIEAECRRIRYLFFKELTKTHGFDFVLVAHNQDDLIETYFMQKKRQNLVKFYGINDFLTIEGTKILRPLLSYSKASLKEYCIKNSVPFAIDSSNQDTKFLRNKIRHEIVSKLSEEERNNILLEIETKNRELDQLFNHLSQLDLHDVDTLKNLQINEFAYALNYMVKQIDDSVSISLGQAKELKKVLTFKHGNVTVPIQMDIVFRKSYSKVEFLKLQHIKYSYTINKPTILETEHFFLDFTCDTSNRNVYLEDYPLTIRTYERGDKYRIKDYEVLVRRLFIDWKMPLSLRETWPLIVNKDGIIIYIPRYRENFLPTNDINFYVK